MTDLPTPGCSEIQNRLNESGCSPTILERFWSKVFIPDDPADHCWTWTQNPAFDGYGQISRGLNSVPIKAHVLSWIIHFGLVPKGLCVCHMCDNKICVRPDHLWLGTLQQNNRDRDLKGKHRCNFKPLPGELSGRSKLKEVEVIQIKELINGGVALQGIADQFHVSRGCIDHIKQRHSWTYLNE